MNTATPPFFMLRVHATPSVEKRKYRGQRETTGCALFCTGNFPDAISAASV
jgi:hypothetical protein